MILLDEFVYIIYGSHLDSSFPSIPWDHLTLFTGVRGRVVLRSSETSTAPKVTSGQLVGTYAAESKSREKGGKERWRSSCSWSITPRFAKPPPT
jgi:hypothetical protein